MKRLFSLSFTILSFLAVSAQAWVTDELADEAADGTHDFGTMFLGILLLIILIGFLYITRALYKNYIGKRRKDKETPKQQKPCPEKQIARQQEPLRMPSIHKNPETVTHHSMSVFSSNPAILKLYYEDGKVETVSAFYDYDNIEFDEGVHIPEKFREKDALGNWVITKLPEIEGESIKDLFPKCKRFEIENLDEWAVYAYDIELRGYLIMPSLRIDTIKLVKHRIADSEDKYVYVMKYLYEYNNKINLKEKVD